MNTLENFKQPICASAEKKFTESYSATSKVRTNDNETFISMAVPGRSKDEINLTCTDRLLTIQIPALARTETNRFIWKEFNTNAYEKSFVLSEKLDTQEISATLENGLLVVRIPFLAAAKPRKINVQ